MRIIDFLGFLLAALDAIPNVTSNYMDRENADAIANRHIDFRQGEKDLKKPFQSKRALPEERGTGTPYRHQISSRQSLPDNRTNTKGVHNYSHPKGLPHKNFSQTGQNNSIISLDVQGVDRSSEKNMFDPTAFDTLPSSQFMEIRVADAIQMYVRPVIAFVGVLGNALTIAVMLRPTLRDTQGSMYFVALSAVDLTILILNIPRHTTRAYVDFDIRKVSQWTCRWHIFLLWSFMDLSAWIIAAIAIDRAIAVCQPLRKRQITTRRRNRIVLLFLTFLTFAVNFHVFWSFGDSFESSINGTTLIGHCELNTDAGLYAFNTKVRPWVDLLVWNIIPLMIMLICNYFIIANLRKVVAQRKLLNFKRHHCMTNKTNRTTVSLALMLIAISISFFIFTSPTAIYLIIEYEDPTTQSVDDEQHLKARKNMIYSILGVVTATNYATNFICYCVSGTHFRREAMSVFLKRKPSASTIERKLSESPLSREEPSIVSRALGNSEEVYKMVSYLASTDYSPVPQIGESDTV
ncbi:B1 bradykinin receptor-like [Lingula anatina]|uniref:B1 bradykinin receptor-like n=1 Tax=Lingula anatina TaxID=7574 RepID=A0A1S3JU11_LINAN|nr:B1 bradykinin receptor-like [Lingula anatina]|eukprot:XP_013413860.1 B1 bradykinin receptor-like [Lingula anatina]